MIAALREADPSLLAQAAGLSGAEVWLESDRSKKTRTNASGVFDLTPVPLGTHRVVASYTSSTGKVYKWRSGLVTLTPSAPTNSAGAIQVVLATGTVSGTLLSKTGQPIANAQVTVWGETVTTNANGFFSLPFPMPPVRETLEVRATGFQPASLPVNFADPPPVLQTTLAPAGDTNRPPTLTVIADRYSGVSNSGVASLTADASDPDGNTLTFQWSATQGTIATFGSDRIARWTAPATGQGVATITCIASDTGGLGAQVQIGIAFGSGGGVNLPPTTPAITASSSVTAGALVNLSAVATDPEGLSLTYSWIQTSGAMGTFQTPTNSPSVTWMAPLTPTLAVLAVRVSDGVNTATGTVQISVTGGSGGTPPVATITMPMANALFNATESPYLRGSATDAEEGNLSAAVAQPVWLYSFEGQPDVAFASGSFNVYFPIYMATGSYVIGLRVRDSAGNVGGASLPIRINDRPVVQINAPGAFSVHLATTPIDFQGEVLADEDLTDGVVSPTSFTWYYGAVAFASQPAFTAPFLPPGTHTISLTYRDRKGLVGTDARQIFVNTPPKVTIASPSVPGLWFLQGAVITVVATSTDPDEPAGLPDGRFMWWDNGILISTVTARVLTSTFGPGSHTILVRGTDAHGAYSEASTSIRINRPPSLSYTVSPNKTVFAFGETFTVNANAVELDGDPLFVGFSRNGGLTFVASATSLVSSYTTPGPATITIVASDSFGASTTVHFSFTVNANTPPTVQITSPTGTNYPFLTSLTFVASASDFEDGGFVPGTSVKWQQWTGSTWVDWVIGTSSYQIATLPDRQWTIRAVATDSQGNIGSATITLTIASNTAPTMYITAPATDNTWYLQNQSISLAGYGYDNDEKAFVATSTFVWKYDAATINTATATFVYTPPTTLGTHTITLEGTDSSFPGVAQKTGSTTRTVFINASPTVSILSPASGTRFDTGTSITFTANATDPFDTLPTVSWFSGSTFLSHDNPFTTNALASGPHNIICYASDTRGLYAVASISIFVNTLPTGTITIAETQYATGPSGVPIYLNTGSSLLTFTAVTYDQEYGGPLPDEKIGWFRNTGGSWTFLGSGTTFSTTFANGSATMRIEMQDSHYGTNPRYASSTAQQPVRMWQALSLANPSIPTSIDHDGSNFYVVASGATTVFKYQYTGLVFNEIASYGPGTFTDIITVTDQGSNLYVLDKGQKAIYSMNNTFGGVASISQSALNPLTVGLAYNGSYYFVTEPTLNQVRMINPLNGNIDQTFTAGGLPSANFNSPQAIRFLNNQFLLADAGNNRAIRFNSSTQLVNEAAQYNATAIRDIAVVGTQYVITCSETSGKLVVFDYNTGAEVTQFAQAGTGLGQISQPASIYFHNGDIFLAEKGTNRIQVFKTGSTGLFNP
ncbi:MAG: Glycoprotein gp2 [Candidatus Ozemobacter sibiricus]|uniref:Glycoprotein gp2 n=1 Tax=Candidatus Ozemobacter sibiricus TaxID=2268124 RepID=A0A367ZRD2_9BACT|nr:MAG: Glycoprotein gp2 [Candidatus Ozemobacter sibiricus]